MLYGAIIGDIAGSVWEFDSNMKARPRFLFSPGCAFTDDTVITIAVADALLHGKPLAKTMREWGKKYPHPMGGYGVRFSQWLRNPRLKAYNSFGNGSAMRVSSVGWIAPDLKKAMKLAEETAVVTHNHPEGIKGAKVTAGAIHLAKVGASKADIKKFVEDMGYDLSRTCDEIKADYSFNETCQGTVPEAITVFLESTSFEDCIKLGVSIGGDSDTLCAIAGSIAEAYYGIPMGIKNKCREYLTDDILEIIDEFEKRCGK